LLDVLEGLALQTNLACFWEEGTGGEPKKSGFADSIWANQCYAFLVRDCGINSTEDETISITEAGFDEFKKGSHRSVSCLVLLNR
jgi:hypothetical protein